MPMVNKPFFMLLALELYVHHYPPTLNAQNVSAVPVLGINDRIVGNISARDLRQLILNPALFRLIDQPVTQFLAAASLEHEAMCPAITSRPRDTLAHVITQARI
jgi:hypothetical protein